MVHLSCHCRNVVISVNEMPKAFTATEYANRSNLLPKVDAGDEAFSFVGSYETMAPVKLALGGVKVVYPDLLVKRDIGIAVLNKCAICSVYTHATDPSQQEARLIVVNLGLERDPMKLRQSDNFSSVFEVIIDEEKFASAHKENANSSRSEVMKNIISEIQNRSFESCQRKQREKEEKIREFQQQCNREYEEFQRRVNRDRDSLLRCVMTLSMPDTKQTDRPKGSQKQRILNNLLDNSMDIDKGAPLTLRSAFWSANNQSDTRLNKGDPVLNPSDLEDMDMVYGNEEVVVLPNGPAFDASDDSNSSNESTSRSRRRVRIGQTEVAQSAPIKVPAFLRKSSDEDDEYEDSGRPFDFRRMTMEAASLSRFTNKSVVSDGTELFGPFPDSGSNPPL